MCLARNTNNTVNLHYSLSMAYLDRLEMVSQDVSLNSAALLYSSTSQNSFTHFPDPTNVKEELSHLQEFSSKLKFQYLEQETRDKFLRLMLMGNDKEVSQTDVDQLLEKNAIEKMGLKKIKTKMYSLIDASEAQAEDVISLNRSFEARNLEVSNTLKEIDNLQEELDMLLSDPDNENHKTLFNLKKIIDTEDIGLNEAIKIATNALDQDVLVLSKLEDSVERAKLEVKENDLILENLNTKLKKLETSLQDLENKPKSEEEPQQVFAQWLREMNASLEKFIPVTFRFNESAQTLHLASHYLKFDREFNILACSYQGFGQTTIQKINQARGTTKFWKLLRLLSNLIFNAEHEQVVE